MSQLSRVIRKFENCLTPPRNLGLERVLNDLKKFIASGEKSIFVKDFAYGQLTPITHEFLESAGVTDGHYFHQDLMVAQEIFDRNPLKHVDIGSRIDGFVAHVASFREIEVIDIRSFPNEVRNIKSISMDMSAKSEEVPSEFADSISCLHAIEHFGLGRYSDPINFDGWFFGLMNLVRMLKAGGILYFSVPTGEIQRIEFNAHRIFSVPFLRNILERNFDVLELAFVNDEGDLLRNLALDSPEVKNSLGSNYGLSIWVLQKRTS
jgi:hypothetical protein